MKRTNVIMIISDDQGAWALGCAGNDEILTPNLDRLAASGVRYDNFFCASPVCSPARATLLTGKLPSQHGVHDWIMDDSKEQEEVEYLERMIGYTDILASHGYHCGLSGKWHLGNSAKVQKGFKHWYCHKSGGGPYYGAPVYVNGKLKYEEKYITEAITDDAISFIDNYKEGPFYLQVGYTAPHAPWLENHPREFTELYDDCRFDSVKLTSIHSDAIYLTEEVLKDERANQVGYFAAVSAMDYQIGRIIEKLEQEDLLNNTLIVFTSDNGFSCGQHGFWGKGNGTFPLNLFDTSVKVPLIISHQGSIPVNRVRNNLVSAYDFMPFLLDYLEIPWEKDESYPGKSFKESIFKEKNDENFVVVVDEYGPNRMIRTKDYKYIHRYPYGPHEFYNLIDDPHELNNEIDNPSFQKQVRQYHKMLREWFEGYVISDVDGSNLSVYGSGQKKKVTDANVDDDAFHLDDYIKKSRFYKAINEPQ